MVQADGECDKDKNSDKVEVGEVDGSQIDEKSSANVTGARQKRGISNARVGGWGEVLKTSKISTRIIQDVSRQRSMYISRGKKKRKRHKPTRTRNYRALSAVKA